MASRTYRVAIIGAGTAAGRELGAALVERSFPLGELKLFSAGKSAGSEIDVGEDELTIEALDGADLRGFDLAFIAPGQELPEGLIEKLLERGAAVIDGSGQERGDGSLLIFPGINEELLDEWDDARGKLLSLPSPAAAQLAAILLPLIAQDATAQAQVVCLEPVSAAGDLGGMEELSSQTVSLLSGKEPESEAFPHRIAFNVLPSVGGVGESGESSHERRISAEVRALLDRDSLSVGITSAVVPVFYGALQFLTLGGEAPLDPAAAKAALEGSDVKIVDDPAAGVFPMPMLAVGDDALLVGRIRATGGGLALVSAADSLRWGTIHPMTELARLLIENELL